MLAETALRFGREVVLEDIGNSQIYFFQEDLTTEAQRCAFRLARDLEKKDLAEQQCRPLPNLAIPFY
jgi:hypothetical protein